MIQKGVAAGIAAAANAQPLSVPAALASRTTAEIGSPEFAEDRTQVNSLNNKWIFESAMDRYWARTSRSDDHYADLQSRGLDALTENNALQKKVNQKFFDGCDDRARMRDGSNYTLTYDLSNPNTLGTSDVVRGAVDPQNRAIDTATAQSTLNNTTMQTAIEAAVANALTGTIPTLEAAIGAAVAAALINTPVKTAA
jgi:hypothetical protein